MNNNIFIPKQINVGFQNRSDTYTKKLAYIIYFDHKGVLRKETSWQSWRDKEIDNIIHENVPTSGFVLNKKVGGYASHYNHRQTYVRVYDPRGFEFEISVPNLLYILENTNSIKGKGLEGDFIFAWEGKELLLIPTESPDYKEITEFNEIMHTKTYIKGKELILGATYLTKDNQKYVYLGKFEEYYYNGEKKKGKSFYFYSETSYGGVVIRKSLGEYIISVESEECVANYADLIDELEKNYHYSPIDDTKDEYVNYTKEELEDILENRRWRHIYIKEKERTEIRKDSDGKYYYQVENPNRRTSYGWGLNNEPFYLRHEFDSVDDILSELSPCYLRKYLENGKLYSEGK